MPKCSVCGEKGHTKLSCAERRRAGVWKQPPGPVVKKAPCAARSTVRSVIIDSKFPGLRERLGTAPDTVLAKEFGMSPSAMGAYRRDFGVPMFGVNTLTAEAEALLGKMPDTVLAKKLGITDRVVQRFRKERNIACYRENTEWKERAMPLLGKQSDNSIARDLGISSGLVTKLRHKMNIPALFESGNPKFRQSRWCRSSHELGEKQADVFNMPTDRTQKNTVRAKVQERCVEETTANKESTEK